MKPYHFNRTLGAQKASSKYCQTVLPINESYESKTGCNRTLATVFWVPLTVLGALELHTNRKKSGVPTKGMQLFCSLLEASYLQLSFLLTVRAEIITELILERAGPVILKTFLLELIAFRLIPDFCPARREQTQQSLKLLETIINSKQGLSRNKISNFSEINSWKHFSGSAIILVPTALQLCLRLFCSHFEFF